MYPLPPTGPLSSHSPTPFPSSSGGPRSTKNLVPSVLSRYRRDLSRYDPTPIWYSRPVCSLRSPVGTVWSATGRRTHAPYGGRSPTGRPEYTVSGDPGWGGQSVGDNSHPLPAPPVSLGSQTPPTTPGPVEWFHRELTVVPSRHPSTWVHHLSPPSPCMGRHRQKYRDFVLRVPGEGLPTKSLGRLHPGP